MPTDYGKGRLADAIRAAIARPFNDAGQPDEFPSWRGAGAEYRLHVHRCSDGGLYWIAHVRSQNGIGWDLRMARHVLLDLGEGDAVGTGPDSDGWALFSRPCSPAEVREIEGEAP